MRRTKEVEITAEGRDKGKVFVLTEMPAEEGEIWATRALERLAKIDVPVASAQAAASPASEGDGPQGMQALAVASSRRVFTAEMARALQTPELDNMWAHVRFQPKDLNIKPRALLPDDIEEWRTRLRLRVEFLGLHTDFFQHAKA